MGRKRQNTVYRYFDLTSQDGAAICLVNECRKLCKTKHSGNLLRHLEHHHKDQYNEVMEINKSRNELMNTSNQNSISESVLKECTNLVAVHGRPFSLFKDKAFKNLISLIPGNEATINAMNIRENVKVMASKLRYEISNEIKDKIFSLKIDIASLGTRSFMGINCQYVTNGEIILKNLGTVEIFERHTSEHLKDLLIFNLNRFNIDLEHNKHIYCITTDNGSNMIKMSKLINEHSSQFSLISNVANDNEVAGPSSEDFTEIRDIENLSDLSNTEVIMEMDNLETDIDATEQSFTHRITDVLNAHFEVGIVRCAAHTLQLALQDACKNAASCNMLAKCREAVRKLRTPKFVRILRENKKNIPKLDCATRWHSAVDMAESLLALKEICTSHFELYLPSSTWDEIETFVQCLRPGKNLTKKLQEEQLTVGDFYLSWLLCKFQLNKLNLELASNILNCMKTREDILFENDIFINGIILDPRINSVLSSDQLQKAKKNLAKLYMQYIYKSEQSMKENLTPTSTSTSAALNTLSNTGAAEMNELDDYLTLAYLRQHDDVGVLIGLHQDRDTLNSLQQSINMFLNEPLLKSTENTLTYWEKAQCKFPYLHKLSSVVIGAPMTQVSVERLFSCLKFVVSNYRLSMKDDIIEDLLFIRSNIIFNNNNS